MHSASEKNTTSATTLDQLVARMSMLIESEQDVDLIELTKDCPQHREQLEMLLPTLQAIVDLERHVDAFEVTGDEELTSLRGRLGDFHIIREIGRGGMGVVYEAEQISLRRRVALKVLPFAVVLDDRQLQRFQNEAQAAALLRHENIVGVHAVGCQRGVHYYAMELIEGQSVLQAIDQLRIEKERDEFQKDSEPASAAGRAGCESSQQASWPVDETVAAAALSTKDGGNDQRYFQSVARLGIQAAEALQYAHEQGVIHRDVKPSNLLLDKTGKLWVADFGLAQMQGQGQLTMTGDLIGTLRYMSPEQAAGNSFVDQRTDVYSLGITLYELIALVPAFDAQNRQQLLRDVLEKQPRSLGNLNYKIPSDLETIVLKATSKDRDGRYGSAQHLADDLKRFLENRPIEARRTSRIEHLWRWGRRNPFVACLIAMISCLLLFLGVGGTLAAWREASLRSKGIALTNSLLQSELALRDQVYDARMTAAQASLRQGNFHRVDDLLRQYIPKSDEKDLRGFEWYYLWRESRRAIESPSIHNWNSIECLSYSLDAKHLAYGTWTGQLVVCDATTREQQWTANVGDRVFAVEFSPDGRIVVTASQDGVVTLWNVDNGEILKSLDELSRAAPAVAFSPNGKLLAIGRSTPLAKHESLPNYEDDIQLFEINTIGDGAETAVSMIDRPPPTWRTGYVEALSFSKDDRWLAAACRDNYLYLYNVESGVEKKIAVYEEKGEVRDVKFSPTRDNEIAVAGGNFKMSSPWGDTRLYDVSEKRVLAINRKPKVVNKVTFSKDETRLATTCADLSISILSVVDGLSVVDSISGHSARVNDIEFSCDDRTLASCSSDNYLKIWDLSRPPLVETINAHSLTVLDIDFSPNDRSLVSGGSDGIARHWDIPSGQMLGEFPLKTRDGMAVDIHPDGSIVALGGGEWPTKTHGELSLWDLSEKNKLQTLYEGEFTVWTARFSPSGDRIAAGLDRGDEASPGELIIWESQTGKRLQVLEVAPAPNVRRLAWSPDGKYIVTSTMRGPVQLWHCESGEYEVVYSNPKRQLICALAYSSDGSSIAAASETGWIRVWRIDNGRVMNGPEDVFSAHVGFVWYLDFSPDSRRLASAGADGTVRVWNVRTGWELLTFREDATWRWTAKFSTDGRTLAVGTNHVNSKIRIYRGSSDHEIAVGLAESAKNQFKVSEPAL